MTPKEKAKELVFKYEQYKWINADLSKECALIAVNEIINNDGFTRFDIHLTEYWQNVKTEISLL
jgi:hypothetical protein